ncbi:phage holin family protein [Halodesulfovibrio sp.]|uniref:phage holin family protein n=1 Tax=Halodesulfovibrio sp. TaxID=1912772 RepID=UPI0025C70C61|nr:phage holin family protein [Halodesulfovibrio sp.]
MADTMNKLHILLRSELALLRLQVKRMAAQTACKIVAAIFALLAIGMFTFASYLGLAKVFGPTMAAFQVALIDAFLAVILLIVSQKISNNAEQEKMILEVREIAAKGLSADLDKVKTDVEELSDDVRQIYGNVAAVISGSSSVISSVLPILGLLASTSQKGKHKKQ